jgi:hypothetical protein
MVAVPKIVQSAWSARSFADLNTYNRRKESDCSAPARRHSQDSCLDGYVFVVSKDVREMAAPFVGAQFGDLNTYRRANFASVDFGFPGGITVMREDRKCENNT